MSSCKPRGARPEAELDKSPLMPSLNVLLDAALAYASRGWPILPLHDVARGTCSCLSGCPAPGKHPRIADWPKQASQDPSVIREWWANWPTANIGLLTGEGSGLVVLDVDPRNGGNASLKDLPDLPWAPQVRTGGGGLHFLFRWPGKYVKSLSGALGPGLDIKGDGGYVVAPPSLHASGEVYSWLVHPDACELPSLPAPLMEAMCKKDSYRNANDTGRIPEGGRNSALASLAGTMRRKGLCEEALLGCLEVINEFHCDPPLGSAEVRGIAKSSTKWPTEDSVFEDGRSEYQPFPVEILPEPLRQCQCQCCQ